MEKLHLPDFQILGKKGEQIAVQFLIDNGYHIIDKNCVSGRYELDIICLKDNEIIFVEVKSHSPNPFFDIKLLVNRTKQKRIIYSANKYLKTHRIFIDARFDIIEVIIYKNGKYIINHIPRAFRF